MFDYIKFVSDNQLTTTSKLKNRFVNEEDLGSLTSKKDSLLAKYKAGEISLDQYKTKMGNTSQKIKTKRADADQPEEPEATDPETEEQTEKI
jgi:hypothetical protein